MALWDSMEKFVNESVRISREAYERTKEFGNVTKLELELKGLQGDLQKEYARLGGHVYHVLGENGGESVSARNETVAAHLNDVKAMADKIFAKEAEIKTFREEVTERRRSGNEAEKTGE
ncbi:MAG: hypothetical protein LBC99_07675 [Spirochaetota bacterium]|jgi:hypothetical protein|nr:hypothetical protein [Spirochaetota bacterium]